MSNKTYFINKTEIRQYHVQNVTVDLEVNSKVFPPPRNNPITAKFIKVYKDESVIDIGTGSGILAIVASKLGGIVSATDNDENAIELSKKNAMRNNVKIDFVTGEYFASFKKRFDVIIANISQTILFPEYNTKSNLSKFVGGGEDGNTHIIEVLKIAKNHMTSKSRLYVNIFSISDYQKTFEQMNKIYTVKILSKQSEPVKEFITDNIEFYKALNKSEKIKIYFDQDKELWMAEQFLCELTLK